EMQRVLKPGGRILWYDMRIVRPDRPLVALGRREIARLFRGCTIDLRAVTLNPLVARLTCPISWTLSDALAALPGLKSHYLAMITP
ncbi:MAG: SAM-dependent methyltransferase, partial [Cyanobacteria bacterium REEB65]|nr:SAM-dependent methyltransferase [Cyanobacteria bacterium REEB65]